MAVKKSKQSNNDSESETSQSRSHEDMILAIAQKQDKESFVALFEYFAPRIKSFLMKGGASPEQADELAQETMLTIWHKASGFNPTKASASTWIFTIARNKKIDALRKLKRESYEIEEPALLEDQSNTPAENVMQDQESVILAESIKVLPEEQADLIKKSFFEGKSHADIAEETGIPLGTIKSRIRLALQRMRENDKVKMLWQ